MASRPRRARLAFLVSLAFSATAHADNWRVIPGLALSETWSDNLLQVPGDAARGGWITDLTPGLRIQNTGGRSTFFLDYRLHAIRYSGASGQDTTQNLLDALGTLEVVDRKVFLDARAGITQESRSPFDLAVAPGAVSATDNRAETKVLQVSPYARGLVGDAAAYLVRLRASHVRSESVSLPDTRVLEWTANLRHPNASARIGWSVDASALSTHNDVLDNAEDHRIRGMLVFAVTPQLHLTAGSGYETTDYTGGAREGASTPSAGIQWAPSDRTRMAAVWEKRFFGDGYNAFVSHRTARTVLRLSSSRDVVVVTPQLSGGGAPGSISNLMAELLAATMPDPAARADAVRRRLEQGGIAPGGGIGSGFLSSRPYVLRSDDASVLFTGTRATLSLSANRRDQRDLGLDLGAGGADPALASFRQESWTATGSWRLTPLTSVALNAAGLRSRSASAEGTATRQRQAGLTLTTQLGPRTNVSAGYRRLDFTGVTSAADTRENAVFVTVGFQF